MPSRTTANSPQRSPRAKTAKVPAGGAPAARAAAASAKGRGVSAASFYCSTGISVFAGSAVALLTALYGSVRRRRRRDDGFTGYE